MKLVAAFLSFGLVLQLSAPALALRRIKRNDFASNDPKVYYRATKAMVAKFKPLIEAVLADLPESENFAKHKHDLIAYLQRTEEEARKEGICFVKTFQQLEQFIGLMVPLRYSTAGAEDKAVYQLFQRHGYKDLEKDFENFVKGYDVNEFQRQVDKLSETDDSELLEEC